MGGVARAKAHRKAELRSGASGAAVQARPEGARNVERLLAEGKSQAECAAKLGVSVSHEPGGFRHGCMRTSKAEVSASFGDHLRAHRDREAPQTVPRLACEVYTHGYRGAFPKKKSSHCSRMSRSRLISIVRRDRLICSRAILVSAQSRMASASIVMSTSSLTTMPPLSSGAFQLTP